jgi:ribosome biogenesis GTPase
MEGRVIEEHKTRYTIQENDFVYSAVVRGVFHYEEGTEGTLFPKVGDYVEFTPTSKHEAVIERVLPRRNEIVRAVVARDRIDAAPSSQVIVANVDVMFIVMGLDADFNPSRAERYALLARQSNVRPVVVLNKSDAVEDPDAYVAQISKRLPNIPVHAVSAATGANMDSLLQHLAGEKTVVMLGSSGAGKSTIMNWLLNEDRQATGTVRADDGRGRHTTTSRQLFAIPTGGFLIDTPGMRELSVLSADEDVAEVFSDIDDLAGQCRYTDCDHEKSDGCAIQEALRAGALDAQHYRNYIKLHREQEYAESKIDADAERQYRDKKKQTKSYGPILEAKYRQKGML